MADNSKSIHVPTPLYRELRHLTQLRDTLVSEMVANEATH